MASHSFLQTTYFAQKHFHDASWSQDATKWDSWCHAKSGYLKNADGCKHSSVSCISFYKQTKISCFRVFRCIYQLLVICRTYTICFLFFCFFFGSTALSCFGVLLPTTLNSNFPHVFDFMSVLFFLDTNVLDCQRIGVLVDVFFHFLFMPKCQPP